MTGSLEHPLAGQDVTERRQLLSPVLYIIIYNIWLNLSTTSEVCLVPQEKALITEEHVLCLQCNTYRTRQAWLTRVTGEEHPTYRQISAERSYSALAGNQQTFRQAKTCCLDILKLYRNGALEQCLKTWFDKNISFPLHWLTACGISTEAPELLTNSHK